jgi:hypothetical protein
VQCQRRGDLGQAERNITFTKKIKDCKCPVEGLDFVRSLRWRVSHYEPPYRWLNSKLVCYRVHDRVNS